MNENINHYLLYFFFKHSYSLLDYSNDKLYINLYEILTLCKKLPDLNSKALSFAFRKFLIFRLVKSGKYYIS